MVTTMLVAAAVLVAGGAFGAAKAERKRAADEASREARVAERVAAQQRGDWRF